MERFKEHNIQWLEMVTTTKVMNLSSRIDMQNLGNYDDNNTFNPLIYDADKFFDEDELIH